MVVGLGDGDGSVLQISNTMQLVEYEVAEYLHRHAVFRIDTELSANNALPDLYDLWPLFLFFIGITYYDSPSMVKVF